MSSSGCWVLFPARTFLNSGQFVPISPNRCSMVACSSGVLLACENHLPASSRQDFSSKYLVVNSWRWPSVVGPITACRAPWRLDVWRTNCTILAVFLAHSAVWCYFHNAFVETPLASACACMIPAIHISRRSRSAFNWWNGLYAFRMLSWMVFSSSW